MKVFLYLRVSSEEQAKHGYSLDAQEEALKAFCNDKHVILGIYRDEGISGRKPYTKRPAMMQLLHDLEIIKPDMVLFTKLDRWFRNIREYYKVQDILEKNNVYWKAINEEYDTSTASGRLYVNIKLSIAQDEADRTSERIKDVQGQLIAQGRVLGGSCPLGYKIENKRLVFSDDIGIVKDTISHYKMHQSLMMLTRYINEKYDLNLPQHTLKKLLRNPILKGCYRDNPTFCKPLLTDDEWNELQSLLDKNIKNYPSKRIYLFSGMIPCPVCGRKMGGNNDGSSNYYRCQFHYYGSCRMAHGIRETKIEKWLLENVEEDFKVNVTMKPKKKKEDPKKYKDRLKRLNDIYLMGNISEKEYREQATQLQRIIADLSKEPAEKDIKFTATWREVYQELDAEHRRAFWRRIIKTVVIDEDGNIKGCLY